MSYSKGAEGAAGAVGTVEGAYEVCRGGVKRKGTRDEEASPRGAHREHEIRWLGGAGIYRWELVFADRKGLAGVVEEGVCSFGEGTVQANTFLTDRNLGVLGGDWRARRAFGLKCGTVIWRCNEGYVEERRNVPRLDGRAS
jgi:hypothetical protein